MNQGAAGTGCAFLSFPVLTNIRKLATYGLIATALTTLRAVLVLPLLGPEQVGVWKTVMILMPAAGLIRLGISAGMLLRVPYYLGLGNSQQASRLAAAAGTVQAATGVLFACCTTVAALFTRDAQLRVALFAMAAVLLSQLHNYLRDIVIAHRDLAGRSKGLVLAAACDCACSLLLAAKFGLAGLGAGTVVGFAIPAWYLWRRAPRFARARWDPEAWRELWLAGWSSAAADTGGVLLRYVDVAVLACVASPRIVGLYALAQMILDVSLHLTRISLNEVLGPELTHKSSGMPVDQIGALLHRPLRWIAWTLPPVLIIGALAMPSVVRLILPKYVEGVTAGQIMLVGAFFAALQATVLPFLALAGRTTLLARLTVALVPWSVAAQFASWRAGFGIEGVAAISCAVSGLLAFSAVRMALRMNAQGRALGGPADAACPNSSLT